jgi:hypothetical protein
MHPLRTTYPAYSPATLPKITSAEDRLRHYYAPEMLRHVDAPLTSNRANHASLEDIERPNQDTGTVR